MPCPLFCAHARVPRTVFATAQYTAPVLFAAKYFRKCFQHFRTHAQPRTQNLIDLHLSSPHNAFTVEHAQGIVRTQLSLALRKIFSLSRPGKSSCALEGIELSQPKGKRNIAMDTAQN